jgi:hypothetical protein
VVAGSTPVVSFGSLRSARVATLAINPSFNEFLTAKGCERDGDDRRLETLRSLECTSLAKAPRGTIRRAFASCNSYFSGQPYKGYFSSLETVLKSLDRSFYDDSACHLDLVQWATTVRWRDLETWERNELLKTDVRFLKAQLARKRLDLLIINGGGVRAEYEKSFGVRLQDVDSPGNSRFKVSNGPLIKFFRSVDSSGQRIVGWNINLQSTPGVSAKNVEAIAERTAQIASRTR